MRECALWLGCALLNVWVCASEPDSQTHTLGAAEDLVASLHESLLTVMKANADFVERYEQLQPIIDTAYDAPLIARISVGRSWQKLNTEQRTKLTALISELIATTYASRFGSYNNQEFVIISAKSSSRGAIVKARIELIDDDPVTLEYHLRANKIYNVVANGVSDLSLKRADFGAVIANYGIAGLFSKIQQNIDQYRNADS